MRASDDLAALALLLGRLERLNEAVVTGVCAAERVSPAEFRVLAMLRHGTAGEAVRPTDISRWVVQTSGGLTATLRRLEMAGRVERVPDPDDGRVRRVALTDDGAAFYDRLLGILTSRYDDALAGLDIEATTTAVRSLIDALERTTGRASSSEADLSVLMSAGGS